MLSPHPADPTLTTDNLMEVVKEVEGDWSALGVYLDVPHSKSEEIRRLYQSDHHRMEAVVDYYLRYHPTPSWKDVAGALYEMILGKQSEYVMTQYVKGESCDVFDTDESLKQLMVNYWYLLIQAILINGDSKDAKPFPLAS